MNVASVLGSPVMVIVGIGALDGLGPSVATASSLRLVRPVTTVEIFDIVRGRTRYSRQLIEMSPPALTSTTISAGMVG